MNVALEKHPFTILAIGYAHKKTCDLLPSLFGEEVNRIEAMCFRAGVIPVVAHGENTNEVKIVYADGHTVIQTLDQFSQDAQSRWTDEDVNPDIDHVEMQINDKRFPDGIRLIAPPCLDFGYERLVVSSFLPQSDLILFELSATSLFSENERRFVADYLEYMPVRTFFAVNRINNVSDPKRVETDVKPNVRKNLHEVFVDENGIFDEELYNNRVFFVDAEGARCARAGKKRILMIGRKELTIEADIDDTGIPEFEDAVYRFMNDVKAYNARSCIIKCCKEVSESLETKLCRVYTTWVDRVAYQWDALFKENWIKLSLRDRLFLIGGNGEYLIKERLRRLDHAFSDYLRKEEPGLAQVLEEAIQHHMTVLEMQLMKIFTPVYTSSPELYAKFVSALENKYDLKHDPSGDCNVLPELIMSIIREKWISKIIRGPFLSYVLISDVSLEERTNLALQLVRTGNNYETYISQMEKEFCITALGDKMPETLSKYPKFIRECGEEIAEVLGEV